MVLPSLSGRILTQGRLSSEEFFDNDDNFVLRTEYMEETLIGVAEKMGGPDVQIVRA